MIHWLVLFLWGSTTFSFAGRLTHQTSFVQKMSQGKFTSSPFKPQISIPTLINTYPTSEATNIHPDDTLSLAFNEAVQKGADVGAIPQPLHLIQGREKTSPGYLPISINSRALLPPEKTFSDKITLIT